MQLVTHYVIYKRVTVIFYIESMIIYKLQYLLNVAYISLYKISMTKIMFSVLQRCRYMFSVGNIHDKNYLKTIETIL